MAGPQAVILAGPPSITGTPAAEFFFSAEGAAGFSCRLLGGGAASQAAAANASAFTACSNPTCACHSTPITQLSTACMLHWLEGDVCCVGWEEMQLAYVPHKF